MSCAPGDVPSSSDAPPIDVYYRAVGPDGPPALTTGRQLRTLEVYCGRAGWSANIQLRGDKAWFLDVDRSKVAPSFAAAEDALCLNGLDARHFIHLEFADFAIAVLSDKVDLGDLHALHDGLDCTTFGSMARERHKRYPSNAFCGTSDLAYETNYRHHLLYALHLHQRRRGNLLVASMENPEADRQLHPLTRCVAEVDERCGGLGMSRVTLHYCAIESKAFHKPTHLWLRSPKSELVHEFMDAGGGMKFQCTESRPEFCFRNHRHVRPQAGDPGVRMHMCMQVKLSAGHMQILCTM